MWRGVEARPAREARPSAVGPEERLGEGAGAALALCPGDVDYVEPINVGGLEGSASFSSSHGNRDGLPSVLSGSAIASYPVYSVSP